MTNTQEAQELQGPLFKDEQQINEFIVTASGARFKRYIQKCKGNKQAAVELYEENGRISQSLYMPIQIWEVVLRNRINGFLCWKYNEKWPWDERAIRNFGSSERKKLQEAKLRQDSRRNGKSYTDAVVADLSAGFWVALLSKNYEIPFLWRHNLGRIFKNPGKLDRDAAFKICEPLLDLRNRIAHHEPIYHLALPTLRSDLDSILEAMCPIHHTYLTRLCTFSENWDRLRYFLSQISN